MLAPAAAQRLPRRASPGGREPAVDVATLDAVTPAPEVPAPFGECFGTQKGAWAMVLDPVTKDENDAYGTWSILHVGGKRVLATARPVTPTEYVGDCLEQGCVSEDWPQFWNEGRERAALGELFTFDWDGGRRERALC